MHKHFQYIRRHADKSKPVESTPMDWKVLSSLDDHTDLSLEYAQLIHTNISYDIVI